MVSSHNTFRPEPPEDAKSALLQQLKESEARFQMLFEHVAVGMAFVGIQGQWLQVNQKLCSIIGYSHEELLSHSFQEITHPDDLETDLNFVQSLLDGHSETYALEKRYIRKDGSIIWINLTVSLVRDEMNRPLYFISVVEDISERKRVEAESMAHASQLEAILSAMADAIMVYDQTGSVVYASSAAYELFPLETWPEHLSLDPTERAMHYALRDEYGQPLEPDRSPVHRLLNGEVLKGPTALDVMMNDRLNHEVSVSISGSPMRNAYGQITGAVLIAHDVTRRRALERRTQQALEGLIAMAEALVALPESAEQEDKVALKLAALTCSVLDCPRVSIFSVNEESEELRPLAVLGLPPEQLEEWWRAQRRNVTYVHQMDAAIVDRLRHNEVFLLDFQQPPYNSFPNPYQIDKILVAPMCIGERLIGILNLDYGPVSPDGQGRHHYSDSERALASAVAQLSALVFQRQRLLNERAEAQGREVALREANLRMEEFLGVASHELRTPLTTIKANVQLSLRRIQAMLRRTDEMSDENVEKVENMRGMLMKAERQIDVLNRLVGDLIDISRIQTGRLQLHLRQEPCDLIAILQETIPEQHKATRGRRIDLHLPEVEQIAVLADRDRIAQVVTNYLSNALKYSRVDQPVHVSLQIEEHEDGRFARVLVQDYGPGLLPEEIEKVWDIFYQSQRISVQSGSGVGLGLGLHISQTIIERHHGQVGVDSTPGQGSTFWFTLPMKESILYTEYSKR
ncbi:sensor histidine kinase [Tengunoibacter tsumagoiensis]|uniref:histidine kinase n=1 Tax=Tengunoibacter tsumagoiensis TaxID=2014871 RepID=A0A401ZXD2_9CHLR|nr:PAS domain S-box protein [Tengunoibacter tsumagoiensis]GCE11493.1 hypothetical protein KTT_13520 [Tengunoibacter tsumagoiensis]